MTSSAVLIGLTDIVSAVPDTQNACVQTKLGVINLVDTRVSELEAEIAALPNVTVPNSYQVPYGVIFVGNALDTHTTNISSNTSAIAVQAGFISSLQALTTSQGSAISAIQSNGIAYDRDRTNHTGTQTASTISDLSVAIQTELTAIAGVPAGFPPLDANALIPVQYLPPYVLGTTYTVSSQAAMLALGANVGDFAVRTDISATFILSALPASTLANWTQLLSMPGVTSVGLALPSDFTVTVSPITSTGTLTATWAAKAANLVLAGPVSGAATTPTFRSLVADDIPALDAGKITTGVFGRSRTTHSFLPHAEATPLVNVNLAAPGLTFDGYTPQIGETLLLANQAVQAENGPWVWNGASAPLTRPNYYTAGSTVQANYGMCVPVEGGATYAGTIWTLNTAGAITIDTTATSWGLISQSLTQGLVGILGAAKGGTGVNASAATNGQLLIGNPGVSGFSLGTITAGAGITVTNAAGAITIAATAPGGTVTSVGLAAPTEFSVSNSPVVSAGTLTLAWANQTANKFFAAPNGSIGLPTFRTMVSADIPSLDFAKITTGIVPVGQGGTGLGSLPTAGAILVGNNANNGWNISSITGTVNQVNVAASGAGIGLSLPQDIHTGASPTFANLTVTTSLSSGALVLGRASVTTTYAVAAGVSTVFADATGGIFTVTLPSAVSNGGRIIQVKRTSTANNTVTVASAAGNVEGAATYALSGNNQRPFATFASDGTNWWAL
jgi:hypothetical protein